jgi:YfiH family protein
MLVRKNKEVYTLTAFANFKNLVCAFSTKSIGDVSSGSISKEKNRRKRLIKFLKEIGAQDCDAVFAQQPHGCTIVPVVKKNSGEKIKGADGLITPDKNLLLYIFVADCLPIIVFDPKKQIIGIAHAGWRGTLEKIAENLVKNFKEKGSDPKNLLVGFGPAIEFCHYEIKGDVADKFKKTGQSKAILESISGKFYLDLKLANVEQLIRSGVPKSNLDLSLKGCTYEIEDFYSFRGGDKDKRFAAVVGLRR